MLDLVKISQLLRKERNMEMSDTIFLILFLIVFIPLLLINFQKIQIAQKEMIALLRELNQRLAEMNGKKGA